MEQSEVNTLRPPLFEKHQNLGAKIVNFSGWEMPIQYAGILLEHEAVRTHVGLFDVSHMGRLIIEGPEAEAYLDYLSTNRIKGKKNYTAAYTVWTNENGGCVDDVLVFKESPNHFFVIVNAGNRNKDLTHALKYAQNFDVAVHDRYQDEGILALQGPMSLSLIRELFPDTADLQPFHFVKTAFHGRSIIISRTGYTGENGVEIYTPVPLLGPLWDQLLLEGKKYGIHPIGLGARDTLRLEMGFALYGHELSDTITPLESVSAWTVKMDKANFLGREALIRKSRDEPCRHAYGAVLNEKGIAREGCPVYLREKEIGIVTSGGFSPSLNRSIALLLVDCPLNIGDTISIDIRNKKHAASIVKLPFYHPQKTT